MCLYIYTYIMFIHLPNFKRTSSRVPSLHNCSALVFLGVGNSCARRHCANGPPCSLPLSRLFPSPKYGFIKAFWNSKIHQPGDSPSPSTDSTQESWRHIRPRVMPSAPAGCLLTGPAWPSAEDSQAASIFPSVPAEWEKIKDLGHIE